MGPNRYAALCLLEQYPDGLTSSQIAEALNWSQHLAAATLYNAGHAGHVVRIPGPRTFPRSPNSWRLTTNGIKRLAYLRSIGELR